MPGRSVDILINAKDNATPATHSAAAAFKNLQSGIMSLKGALVGGIGGVGLAAAFKSVIGSFTEAESATAKLGAVLKATGNASGFSLKQLRDYSGELQDLVAVDDDVIASNMGILASFRNVRGQVFKDATKAALDLSAVMGQDLQSSIVQVGKALNDPATGLTALRRVGVTFSEGQKALIKEAVAVGDVLKAQKIILQELNSEFGGAAAAAAETLEGKINKLALAFDGLKTAIGAAMAPKLGEWLGQAAEAVNIVAGGGPERGVADEMKGKFRGKIFARAPDLFKAERDRLLAEQGQILDAMNAVQSRMKERRDAVRGFGFLNPFNLAGAFAQGEDAKTLERLKLQAERVRQQMGAFRKDNAGAQGEPLDIGFGNMLKDALNLGPQAGHAVAGFAKEIGNLAKEMDALLARTQLGLAFGDLAGKSTAELFGIGLNRIGSAVGPIKNRLKPSDVFGGSPFTEGGRIVNQAFENRGLHSAPFTDVKPELKTLQQLLAEAKGEREWRDKMLKAVERDPATARQILEIRSQLN